MGTHDTLYFSLLFGPMKLLEWKKLSVYVLLLLVEHTLTPSCTNYVVVIIISVF